MLSGISLACFATSYLIVLSLEVSRLVVRLPVRWIVMVGFTSIGLLTHTIHLYNRAHEGLAVGAPLSSWYDWYVLASWIMAATYLGLVTSRPQTSIGIFMLPVVLALTGVAKLYEDAPAFNRSEAMHIWGMFHGLMLLLGTVAVSLGFVAGLMYLVQSYRLKLKIAPQQGLKLPSLEWLERLNKQSLLWSSACIALGLLAGVVMNAIKSAGDSTAVPWTDSVIITSAVLLSWLIAASIFEFAYKPAQQGRKVAYLTVASFVFLAIVFSMLVWGNSKHTAPRADNANIISAKLVPAEAQQ